MANKEFRELLLSKGINPKVFEIPKSVLKEGADHQLRLIKATYELGGSSLVIVYDDKTSLEQALHKIRSILGDQLNYVDFSYEQTVGKKRIETDPLKDKPTFNLVDHLFTAEETEFTEKTLVLYHSFNGLIRGVETLARTDSLNHLSPESQQINGVISYLDGGCGRGWTHAHGYLYSPRLQKLSGNEPIIRSALVMSIDERVANDWYAHNYTSCTRAWIGHDFSVHFIF